MFNFLVSVPDLFKLSLFSFLLILTVSKLLFKGKIYLSLYYVSLTIIIFMFGAIVGGSVVNDAYDTLEEFRKLEENNMLEFAKTNNLQEQDGMLQIDLEQFKSSSEFEKYIQQEYEAITDKAEAASIGLIFAILAEISLAIATALTFIIRKIRS